mgnify:CR=1 FL=1
MDCGRGNTCNNVKWINTSSRRNTRLYAAVTIPDYPSEKGTPTITVDDPSTLPDGNTPGTVNVPVTVTYPDGTEDHVTVPVTTNEQADNDAYQPTTDEVTKDYGNPTTEEDVTGAVTIPDYPSEKGTPTITVDDSSTLPDGNTPGTVNVPVTVTYPDGTKDHVTVPVTTGDKPHEKGNNDDTNVNGNHNSNDKRADNEDKNLPETGNNEQSNGTLLGSLFAAAGTLFSAGKRRKNRSDKK